MAFNILIVDDSSIVRKSLKKALEMTELELGTVFEAENGQVGLDVLKSNWIDLVFLDINMPVMNGMEFMHAIRNDDLLKQTPVIIISTEGSLIRAEELKALGVSTQLRKPLRPEVLTEHVLKILGASK